jgi:hypothetical protein
VGERERWCEVGAHECVVAVHLATPRLLSPRTKRNTKEGQNLLKCAIKDKKIFL